MATSGTGLMKAFLYSALAALHIQHGGTAVVYLLLAVVAILEVQHLTPPPAVEEVQ